MYCALELKGIEIQISTDACVFELFITDSSTHKTCYKLNAFKVHKKYGRLLDYSYCLCSDVLGYIFFWNEVNREEEEDLE